ncbi:MAG: DUF6088 family protein [Acidimicrobiales bacterium]
MKTYKSTSEAVVETVLSRPAGEPFTTSELLELGTRAGVDHALSRLAGAGTIERLAPGLFVRPRQSKYVGNAATSPEKIVQAIARKSRSLVEVHGAQAAREFGFTTQVSMRPVFVTTGPAREIAYGTSTIVLRHAAPSRMLLAGRPAGRAFAALMYLGRNLVTEEMIATIQAKLPTEEFEALCQARASMPSWLNDVLYRYERAQDLAVTRA